MRSQVRLIVPLAILFILLEYPAAANTAVLHSTFEQRNGTFAWRGPAGEVILDLAGDIRISGARPVTLYFPGAKGDALPLGELSQQVSERYYTQRNPEGVVAPHFKRVRYRNLYPGVDLVFYFDGAAMEYDFELAPYADPGSIRIACRGGRAQLTADGEIEIRGATATIRQKRPRVIQNDIVIPARYVAAGHNAMALVLAPYNTQQPLTIDPVLNFSSVISGSGFEAAYAMAVDSAGSIYIAGESDSMSFANTGRRSSRDIFVAKLTASGTGLLYLTYLGGNGADTAKAITVDAAGNVYIAGTTNSRDFPVTSGVVGAVNAGFEDAFVVKLSPQGALMYSTLLGSSGSDQALGIAIDSSGNAYVAGQTNGSFPTTSSAPQRAFRGGSDGFVFKLNAGGTALLYSTMLGGGGLDACRGIAVDAYGNAYVTGFTSSTDFPVLAALQPALKGSSDAFVTKINSSGTGWVYSTFLGGSGFSEGNAIAIEPAGAAYVAGDTTSWNFPVTNGAPQSVSGGNYDAFVVKLSAAGNTLTYATLLGGSGADAALSIALDTSGRAVIGGFTTSLNLPQNQTFQSTLAGQADAFAAVVDAGGYSVIFSTYFGGSGEDRAYAVAASGNRVYLAGVTQSPDFPHASAGVSGNSDAFVAQLTYDNPVTSGLKFIPVTQCRVVDTRSATLGAAFGSPNLKGGTSRSFPLPSSGCQIPASARAYSLNVTALPRRPALQYMTIFPAGQPLPTVSTLNAFDGRIVANAALVPAGTGGGISVFVTEDTDALIDINGYFSDPSAGLAFYTLTPCRIADTRGGPAYAAAFGAPYLAGQSSRTFPVPQSPCAPPATPQAYSLNVTALPRKPSLDYVITWAAGQSMPAVSTLNSFNGQIVANAAIVSAGAGGGVSAFVSQDAELILDANGYFASAGAAGALSFTPVTPCRVADTRDRSTPLGTADSPSRSFDVVGGNCGIPLSARAYAFNITVVPAGPLQFLQVWPTGQSKPAVSTLNSFNGAVVANAAIVPAGLNGKIDVFASDRTEVIIDINGYFAP